MKNILVVGSANVDFVVTTERLPQAGETVPGGDLEIHFGGKGANQAVAAARLGGRVSFAGMLGNDAFGPKYRAQLEAEGIALDALQFSVGRPTGSAAIAVDSLGNNTIIVSPGANGDANPRALPKLDASIADSDLVLLQFEIPMETNDHVIERANRSAKIVIVNPSPLRDRMFAKGLHVDFLVLNEVELACLAKRSLLEREEEIAAAALSLRGNHIRNVIVTRGARNTLAFGDYGSLSVPAFPVKPVDTVAAGDTFTGALAVALIEARPMMEAIRFANAAAALATLTRGAQPSIPRRQEVDRFLAAWR